MILDLVIILVIAIFTFLGYKKGLVKTAISILSFFIALIISIMLYKTVGNMIINNTEIDEVIVRSIRLSKKSMDLFADFCKKNNLNQTKALSKALLNFIKNN